MESKAARAVNSTPAKSKLLQKPKLPENSNPNFKSPENKSVAKISKSTVKKPKPNKNPITSPNKIRDRKFVVAKKNSKAKTVESVNCKCKINSNSSKCLCVAYQNLRVSQDEFKKNGSEIKIEIENPSLMNKEEKLGESEIGEGSDDKVSAIVKRRRDKLMEVARQSVPETGCGRVMHLVKAFENALTLPKSETGIENGEVEDETVEVEVKVKVPKWELPGLRPKAPVTEFSSPELFLTRESLGLESRGSTCSLDSNPSQRRNSGGGRRSRRNSFESSATSCGTRGKRRTIKATPQKPFNLKTEQRGKSKQEEFIKKVQEMMIDQENQRIRVAQGLPWTTDEPECLAKPPVKETTRPVDLVLHSDTRAMERAEFDNQVQGKLAYIEQYKQERERQQKLEEEEELRRLRKELVPKAQPMPYFDKPFVPRRSERQPTMPKEPKFHNPQPKKMHGGTHS